MRFADADLIRSAVKSPWHKSPAAGHWYAASTKFAKERLVGTGSCLVIGSPLFEIDALKENGWDITYLDVRKPPGEFTFVLGDATEMSFPDGSFDAVSSACVLTHAGLGRYGDKIVARGDEKMLCEISRVLKRGCKAAITFGPVADMKEPVTLGNIHRVYTIEEARRMAQLAGLEIEELKIWGARRQAWVEKPNDKYLEPDYLSVILRHVVAAEQG